MGKWNELNDIVNLRLVFSLEIGCLLYGILIYRWGLKI